CGSSPPYSTAPLSQALVRTARRWSRGEQGNVAILISGLFERGMKYLVKIGWNKSVIGANRGSPPPCTSLPPRPQLLLSEEKLPPWEVGCGPVPSQFRPTLCRTVLAICMTGP